MFRTQHAFGACLVVIASVIALAHGTEPSSAATPCDQRVLADWSDNGRIDGIYPLGCYEEAIAALPLDLRDYTNAEAIIGRALTNAVRRSPSSIPSASADQDAAPAVATSGGSSLPLSLVLVAGVSVALVAAGGLGYVSRRRRDAN
jgi:hypothetical protein